MGGAPARVDGRRGCSRRRVPAAASTMTASRVFNTNTALLALDALDRAST